MEPHDMIHIVFIYAKEDYDTFMNFLGWFKEILRTLEQGDTVTYETHDSELFTKQQDNNHCNICERAIYILPFLSPSFCSNKRLRFFTSDAIGKTRLRSICPKGALEITLKKQTKYAVRPIHTADPRSGTYRIPTGLTMMKGVEYYSKDKHVGYVKNQITGIIKEAIRKFDERNAAIANALTGIDQIPEIIEERSEKQTGSRLIKSDIGIVSHYNSNDLALTQHWFGVQEKPVKSLVRGEYSTLTTESMTAETDGNTFLTDNTSSYTQGYKQFYDATALTNRKTKSSKTRITSEGETLRLLEVARNVFIDNSTGFSLATSHNDILLDIDNESLHENTVQNATLKAAKAQDQDCTGRALNIGLGVRVCKDSGKGVRTNYVSCTGSSVYNNTEENPRHNDQIITKYAKKNSPCINETKCNDTGSTTQNFENETSCSVLRLTEESFSKTRTKMVTNEGTLSKGFDTTDIDNDACLFADKFPNDFSRTSQNIKHSSQGETHIPLRSTIDSYESVLGLCKNSTKRFGSLDNGYHTNFSHIYKTSQTRRPGTEQDDDEVD